PEPLQPLSAVALDGYLCGVLVQPRIIAMDEWLPHAFDTDARPLPHDTDPAWHARTVALIRRRHAVLSRSLLGEEDVFDPLIFEWDEDDAADEEDDGLDAVSRPLMPWVAGFH